MLNKSDVASIFPELKKIDEHYFQPPIFSIYSDNGGELTSSQKYSNKVGFLILQALLTHLNTTGHSNNVIAI